MWKKMFFSASSFLLLVTSSLNLVLRERFYRNSNYSILFYSNDIITVVISICFVILLLAVKTNYGLIIGINTAIIYSAFPLLILFNSSVIEVLPIVIILISITVIIIQLEIEDILIKEKGTIRKEHIIYMVISALFIVIFIARSVGILTQPVQNGYLSIEQITSISDLFLVLVWIVLLITSIINVDKRIKSLSGIMVSGSVLNLSLLGLMFLELLRHEREYSIIDFCIISVMSLVFILPMIRLIRNK
jgi:hypothetical protein